MESRNTFKSQFERLRNKEKTLRARIAAMEYYLDEEDRGSYFQQALLIEECAEQLTLAARTLPSYIGHPDAEAQVEAILKQEIPVEIGYTKEGWFSVRIPMLLPKKSKGSTDYIRSFLYPAMRDFFVEKPPVRYREAVLIYRHVYDRRRPERQMGIMITLKSIWFPISWRCMSCRTTVPPYVLITIAAQRQSRSGRRSMWFPRATFRHGFQGKLPCPTEG